MYRLEPRDGDERNGFHFYNCHNNAGYLYTCWSINGKWNAVYKYTKGMWYSQKFKRKKEAYLWLQKQYEQEQYEWDRISEKAQKEFDDSCKDKLDKGLFTFLALILWPLTLVIGTAAIISACKDES